MPAPDSGIVLTRQTRAVLEAIRDGHDWGLGIMAETGLAMSTTYRVLRRLRGHQWVTAETEPRQVADAQRRPQRTLYRLTAVALDGLGWTE